MTSPLENLAAQGDLHQEPPAEGEIETLIERGKARLTDAGLAANSLPGRFDLAYNAAFALALAALRRKGYRIAQNRRYLVFQCLPHTLGLGPNVWGVLAKAHSVRNAVEYDGAGDLNERLVEDTITATRAVARKLEKSGS